MGGFLRTRSFRLAAFLAAVGGAAALVGTAASGTGAYFTDVQGGQVNGGFGTVTVAVDGVTLPPGDSHSGLAITWNNMLPGTDKTVTWTVKNTGTGNESIWLAFDNSNQGWFNANGNTGINNLGTYGDAKINSPLLNKDFNNLDNLYPQGSGPNPGQKNACGDPVPAIAYLPAENHVADLSPGASTSFTFSFGYTACLSANVLQGGPAFLTPLLYDIIATQQGVTPDDTHNGGVYAAPITAPAGTVFKAGETWNW